ncbi:hypothetical protein Bpfe_031116 [Biomphalaria pfeifferi]|uniref:Uncharacterized protein n=1 Tax=Biomphalaria pfeifferi TaxID=112525 RepID=A0AAD8EUP4_BIOPF|nr:hypothetical protein Bpfe_031116 [Biomphalaria pfeifferi]
MGFLPRTEEAAALWQFLIMAMQALDKVPTQTTLEGEGDLEVDMLQLAHSSRRIYGLKDLEGMFHPRLIDAAKREAKRSRLAWYDKLDAFFESGGKSYRFLSRNPDKVGKGVD